jgi:hypothetical protein
VSRATYYRHHHRRSPAPARPVEEPTRPELERFFFLDDVDRDLIALRRMTAHRLGFAVQICYAVSSRSLSC